MTSHLPGTKRSDGNTTQGLTVGEITGLIVGISEAILAALTVFIGWKSRRVSNNKYYFMVKYSHIGVRRSKQTLPLETSIITHRCYYIDVLTFRSLLGRKSLSIQSCPGHMCTNRCFTRGHQYRHHRYQSPLIPTKGQHGRKRTGHLLGRKIRYCNSCSSTLMTDDQASCTALC